jgi:type VI secretion system secreted protein Hcp
MAFDAFLKLDGIKGESQVKGFEDQIQIESFHWGVAEVISQSGGGGGAVAGRPTKKDFLFTAASSKASPLLFQTCVSGKHITEGTLTLRSAGGSQTNFSTIKLTELLIAAYDQAGDEDGSVPMDEVSINFTEIDFTYNGVSAHFDFSTLKA